MSDAVDEIDFTSRFSKGEFSRYVDLLFVFKFEFIFEFKRLVVFSGPWVV